jgi:hypothetical protein
MTDSVITDIRSLPEISQLGLVDMNTVQINCQRALSGENFVLGTQDFLFSVAGNQKWSPSRSFFRARISLQKSTNAGVSWSNDITLADKIAFAESPMNNCYANAYCYASSVDISSLTQFVGQGSMVKHRLTRPKPWLDSIGKAYLLGSSFLERQALTARDASVQLPLNPTILSTYTISTVPEIAYAATDLIKFETADKHITITKTGGNAGRSMPTNIIEPGNTIRFADGNQFTVDVIITNTGASQVYQVTAVPYSDDTADIANETIDGVYLTQTQPQTDGYNSVEVCFQPPVGLFSSESAMPSGAYKISLMPRNDLAGALEKQGPYLTTDTRYRMNVDEMYFFMSVFRTERSFDSGTYYLSLDEMNISTKPLGGGSSQNSLNFTIPSSTIGIATFVQSVSTGSGFKNYLPPSIFKSCIAPGLYIDTSNAQSNNVNTLQLTFSNTSKPVQNFSSGLEKLEGAVVVASNPNITTRQFLTQRWLDTQINSELYALSSETFNDWLTRGALYYYSFIRPSDDRSTELQIQISFNGNLPANQNNLYIVAIYRKLVKISVDAGFITNVESLMM